MRFGDTRRLAPALIRAMPRQQLAIGFAVAFALTVGTTAVPAHCGGARRRCRPRAVPAAIAVTPTQGGAD